jgi:hypothetical protein
MADGAHHLTEAQRAIVHDVVYAASGRAIKSGDSGADRVVNMHKWEQAAIAADRGQSPAPHKVHHLQRRGVFRTVEKAVPQNDAFDRPSATGFQYL